MGLQLIFVVESDRTCGSDWIYIRSVLDRYYNALSRRDIKLSSVFMNGKGNYKSKRVLSSINSLINQYSRTGDSQVTYCFDTDKYESDQEALNALEAEKEFCSENGYDFVWFCHDVEEVFIGKKVHNKDKKQEAIRYAAKKKVNDLNKDCLACEKMMHGTSNLLIVLDEYLGT